jgi:predicted nucleic acid-binding protein
MILVDTSVWIDYFNGNKSWQTSLLDDLLGSSVLATGDLILAELLQGLASEADARKALQWLEPLEFFEMAGRGVAVESARNHRLLRRRGVTVRKTMDMLIGTCCLMRGLDLLHDDRDFDVMARNLGLRVVRQDVLR